MTMSRTPAPRAHELERVSPETQEEARSLLEIAGAPELAKQAVASSAGHPAKPAPDNDAFGKRFGFGSYLEMFEASKPLGISGDKHWLVTNVGPEQWIVWNEEDLQLVHTFKSFEEAKAQMKAKTSKADQADVPPAG
jgi:hypothetical protein